MNRRPFLALIAVILALPSRGAEPTHDLVIYGGTSAGVAAAVQAKRMGRTVVVVEPSRRVGGLTTGGLGATDIGNKAAIGGISREFYGAVKKHYDRPDAWTWQTREEFRRADQRTAAGDDAMWTFEPSVALKIYEGWIRDLGIEVAYGERLDRRAGVTTTGTPKRIVALRTESGRTFNGRMFIDATYEGDLMSAAGVSYTVGREANQTYGETLNGAQRAYARHHQFFKGVDPYVRKGDPTSGLLPFIDPQGPGPEGSGDRKIQAYCFRMCITDAPENRIPFAKPAGYDERSYELLLRNFEAGEVIVPWINSSMPNRKTDINNRLGFSTDFIGGNYDYPEASYEERARIVERHRAYQQGLLWTLSHNPRVPDHVRREVSRWGMTKDEFTEGGGWQEQLYVREARRMVGDYVMTQANCEGRRVADDGVALAAYTMDSHHIQRYVDAEGHVRNEGDVQVGGFSPYPISYRALVPAKRDCANLLVPVCMSASHIAYGSIRMEPVFMVLGQTTATAAIHAIEADVPVQQVDVAKLRARLAADGQVLTWPNPTPARGATAGTAPASLEGEVFDDDEHAALKGFGLSNAASAQVKFVGQGYRTDGGVLKGMQTATFQVTVPKPGRYEVRIAYHASRPRNAANVPVAIKHADGTATVRVDQRKPASIGGLLEPVGRYRFERGATYTVTISNAGTTGEVVADAVQLLPID